VRFCAINDIVDGAVNVPQNCLHLLLGIIHKPLSFQNGLRLIAGSSCYVMMQSHLFETLFSWQPAKELKRRVPPRTISRENPLRMFFGEIIDDDVFVERVPATGISSVNESDCHLSLTAMVGLMMSLKQVSNWFHSSNKDC